MRIYKICGRELWEQTQQTGVFPGMPIDLQDGYVHFSTAEQNAETLRKYFSGKTNLMLLEAEPDVLGDALRWEASSSGNRSGLFPHLYAPLKLEHIAAATAITAPEASPQAAR